MFFKPAKSRFVVLKKGRVSEKFRFSIENMQIPTITENPVKGLGKIFKAKLKDKAAIRYTWEECEQWMQEVDNSGLPRRFKAWVYQHRILPRILWPLMLYEFPISTVTELERVVSRFLRRSCKLRLALKSVEEEFKVLRVREVLQYRESSDPKVIGGRVVVKTGRKWRAEAAVEAAEAQMRHKVLVGAVAKGRASLGSL